MVVVYSYAIITTCAVSRVVILSRDDVMAARDASDSKDSDYSPWNRLDGGKDHPEFTGRSMWWKTAARRLEPWVPTSAEYRREQLRAAAAAAEQTAPPAMPQSASNGHHEIVDAELVDDPQAPAAQAGRTAEPPDADVADPQPASPVTTQAGKRDLDKMDALFEQLQLDTEEQDAVVHWFAPGEWTASAAQIRQVVKGVTPFLTDAGGDVAEARTQMWDAYRRMQEATSRCLTPTPAGPAAGADVPSSRPATASGRTRG